MPRRRVVCLTLLTLILFCLSPTVLPVPHASRPLVATAQTHSASVYPQGTQFPLALYSIHTAAEMQTARQFGWNITHRYNFIPSFLEIAAEGGMFALASLPPQTPPGECYSISEDEAAQTIANLATSDRIAWWDLPEERRYWRVCEMELITNYAQWTRRYDPRQRPNYMYIPGHYSAMAVQQYVPYLDIIPASAYTMYYGMPHAWVRWRMETTIKGIALAQANIGPDYLNGEKTPVAVLELHNVSSPRRRGIMTPQGAYHDFWQSIVSGARGILIFSYFRRRDHPDLEAVWQMYSKAASEITGPEQLGSVILYGDKQDNVSFQITAGPDRTDEFIPFGGTDPVSFPSLDLLTKVLDDDTYVIAVNSAEQPVSARITGLPATTIEATVLFEDRTVPVTGGVLDMDFAPLGVHIFKIRAPVEVVMQKIL